jgi:hypothetical protein
MPPDQPQLAASGNEGRAKVQVSAQAINAEALRYLGGDDFKATSIDPMLDAVVGELRKIARPRAVIRFFPIDIDQANTRITLGDTGIELISQDLCHLLQVSRQCGILAGTLGPVVDQRIKYYGVSDLTKSVLLDAAASAYTELYCDQVQALEGAEVLQPGQKFTFRFAPGYGDLGLDIQPQICRLLDTAKRIGLSVSDFNTLYPRKSITGIFGIVANGEMVPAVQARPKRIDHPKCKTCKNYPTCFYLEEGRYCEYRKRNL